MIKIIMISSVNEFVSSQSALFFSIPTCVYDDQVLGGK